MTIDLLHTVVNGHMLTEQQAEEAMRSLLAGESTPVLTAAFLTALRMRGETIEELAGFARAMRAVAAVVPIGPDYRPVLDTCGTGGSPRRAFNISTLSAFVVAGAGVRVAKHGNRSLAGQCGSADVLEALGVKTAVTPEVVGRAIEQVGVGFLFAPVFHSAMRNVQPIRAELKIRTAFNFLGPLTNPARAEMQVCGTWSEDAAHKIAGAMAKLGLRRGYVVHGSDGLGELTITGPSAVFAVQNGNVQRMDIGPASFGLYVQDGDAIQGADIPHNLAIFEAVLSGRKGAPRDVTLMNAGLALIAAGVAETPRLAAAMAAESIDSGAARRKLDQLREVVSGA